MALLGDSDVRQIELAVADKHGGADAATLTRWVRELLEDRKSRTAVIQKLSRHAHYLRQRFGQASRYLDGLLDELEKMGREPWPGKLPCPVCGAPLEQVRSEFRPGDARRHVLVYGHADGTACEARAGRVEA